jgi:hypothetical protein
MLGQSPRLLVPRGGVASRLSDRCCLRSPLPFRHDRTESAISRQPWSMVSEWPRSANSVSSVVDSECWYCLYVDLLTASGTVWSLAPMVSSSGLRSWFFVATFVCACECLGGELIGSYQVTRSAHHGTRCSDAPATSPPGAGMSPPTWPATARRPRSRRPTRPPPTMIRIADATLPDFRDEPLTRRFAA